MTFPSGYDSDDVPVDPAFDPILAPPEPFLRVPQTEDRTVVGELEVPELATPDPEPPQSVLTAEQRADLERLITVGRLFKTIDVYGHRVRIQTLTVGDEMRIGLHTKPYLDTQGFARAYQVGVVACGLVEMKDKRGNVQDLWESLKEINDPNEVFSRNVEALLEFRPTVIAKVHAAIMGLDREFEELVATLGK